MRVLVTGGCGFVGSAVVRLAVERGDQVLNVDRRRRSNAAPALAPIAAREGHARLEADISDRVLLRSMMREFAPDAVIHLATAPAAQSENIVDDEIAPTFSVLEACRAYLDSLPGERAARFRIVHLEQAEPDTLGVLTPSQAARGVAAVLMERWARANDLPLVSCVAGEAFGPWQAPTSFMATLLANLLHERTPVLEHGGENVRDWLPIRDLAAGLLLAAERAPTLSRVDFSVGAERRDIDVAESVCALLDERAPRHAGAWLDLVRCEGDPASATLGPMLDPADAETLLGWKPQGFHTGLDRLLAWALASRAAVQARSLAVAAE